MRLFGQAVALVLTAAGVALWWTMLLFFGLGPVSLPLLIVLVFIYGWMLFTYLNYRRCRQDELRHVLSMAAAADAPLADALYAYVRDRPRGELRELWIALLLLFVLPGYYWVWHRRHCFGSKVEQVALLLEAGFSLHQSMRGTPGVASRDTLLAIAVGEATGQLAQCVSAPSTLTRGRLGMFWLETLPRFIYPLLLLFAMAGILNFWSLYIAPKFQRIFQEFGMKLPEETQTLVSYGGKLFSYTWILGQVLALLAVLIGLLVLLPTLRWFFPVVGGFYRKEVRSQILLALAVLFRLGKPAPEALGLLADTGYFVPPARRRLHAARRRIQNGEPLAASLRRSRILSRSMVPLVKAAERAGNLPWALAQLGEMMAERLLRRAQRVVAVLFPIPIIAVGILVGFVALGLFLPLVNLLSSLAP